MKIVTHLVVRVRRLDDTGPNPEEGAADAIAEAIDSAWVDDAAGDPTEGFTWVRKEAGFCDAEMDRAFEIAAAYDCLCEAWDPDAA